MLVAALCIAVAFAVLFITACCKGAAQEQEWKACQAERDGLQNDCSDASHQIQELQQQLATASLLQEEITMLREIADGAATIETNLRRDLEAAAGRDKQATLELGQLRGRIQKLNDELRLALRDCDIHRNGNDELRDQLAESKKQHAADVALVSQLTVERDRLNRRMVNIADMARTGKGVEADAEKFKEAPGRFMHSGGNSEGI